MGEKDAPRILVDHIDEVAGKSFKAEHTDRRVRRGALQMLNFNRNTRQW